MVGLFSFGSGVNWAKYKVILRFLTLIGNKKAIRFFFQKSLPPKSTCWPYDQHLWRYNNLRFFYYPGKQSLIWLQHIQPWVQARLHNMPTFCTSKEVVSLDTFYPLNTFFTMLSKHDVPQELVIHENRWRYHTEVNNISMSYVLSFSDLLCNKTFLIFTLFYIAND